MIGTCDTWSAEDAVDSGAEWSLRYTHDDDFLSISAFIPPSGRCAEAVRDVYAEIFALAGWSGYPDICRLWHYIGDINGDNADGLEVYRDFCVGRALAFEEFRPPFGMPAATGVGSSGEGITVCVLATRAGKLTAIENPDQVPAYRYPTRYGPKPPSFARAGYLERAEGDVLFLSGTASVTGHETAHRGDLHGQLDRTLANIRTVVGGPNLARHGVAGHFGLADFDRVKVYVRNAGDMAAVEAVCRTVFTGDPAVELVRADLCRSDLLVGIEGVIAVRGGLPKVLRRADQPDGASRAQAVSAP
ncbi:FkbO/Hyg5 family chorismatase [Umezawaea sp. Da 62-37]|uniref:FkbO/Hyg5 family chorismatase n=1 Tax=Umezawaea sp. Da 62-37 TaxID=3075927 RepID=UPI0028F74143|nr:FkbO/Hyg5 family chorismatase [Umezawaea sp. Da 62-37]WNV86462.1 FkbO/Hyg5 family chorismatase [Umezawaea sp. Da 62-37]